MKVIARISRDNERIPMQWDDSEIYPWIKNALNYKEINVKNQQNNENQFNNYDDYQNELQAYQCIIFKENNV